MLGLQRAVVAVHDQPHHVVHEAGVLIDGLPIAERLREPEVEVPVLGVPEDDGVVVAVRTEQSREVERSIGESLHGERDVLDDDRGAAPPDRADRGEHPLADRPEARLLDGIVREPRRMDEREAARHVARHGFECGPLPLLAGLDLDEQTGGAVREAAEFRRDARLLLHAAQCGAVHDLQRDGPRVAEHRDLRRGLRRWHASPVGRG